jgi:acyl-CoA thioesterase-1
VRRLGTRRLALVCAAFLSLVAAQARAEGVIVALGDSLTAGWGLAADEAYPARLEARLRREGYDYRVVNAGVSGDTSAGGLRRVDWVLRTRPEIVIVALGANDGLRGQSPQAMRVNLEAIVTRLQAAGAHVLLAGMRLPPNYGKETTTAFEAVFPAVARSTKVPLMPFLLDGVAADPRLNQPDGIHPTAAGQQVIADNLWLYLRPLLDGGKSLPGRGKTSSGG